MKEQLELTRAWDLLAGKSYNKSNIDPYLCANEYEGWQYMGIERYGSRNIQHHVFRHRCHPITNNRMYVRIKAKVK